MRWLNFGLLWPKLSILTTGYDHIWEVLGQENWSFGAVVRAENFNFFDLDARAMMLSSSMEAI